MVAADNLASYGSLARFKDVERLKPVGSYTVVGAGGDMSDFQHLERTLESLVINEGNHGDGHEVGPKEVYNYLSKLMYARRTKMNPLWNTLLVGGFRKGERCVSLPLVSIHCVPLTEPFPCFHSSAGSSVTSTSSAQRTPRQHWQRATERTCEFHISLTSRSDEKARLTCRIYSSTLFSAQPLLRKAVEGREDTLTQEEATEIMKECMKVLFYRDARSLNKVRPPSLDLHPFSPFLPTRNRRD